MREHEKLYEEPVSKVTLHFVWVRLSRKQTVACFSDFDAFVDRQSSKLTNMVNSTNQKADQLMQRQMIIASGDKWKKLRTTFTPIFTR